MENEIRAQFTQLEQIAKREIAKEDYQQQIDRWNEYQTVLDSIKEQMQDKRGVALAKNVHSNMENMDAFDHMLTIMLSFIGGVFLTAIGGAILAGVIHSSLSYLIGLPIFAIGVYYLAVNPNLPRKTLKFSCKPILHIDELTYMNNFIKGIPQREKDPDVKLPEVRMEIPRRWIAQQSMLDVMGQLGKIKLPENLK